MELETRNIIAKQFGFEIEKIDGCMNPGGSISNLMALLCAREQHFPHVRQEGWRPDDRAVGFAPA